MFGHRLALGGLALLLAGAAAPGAAVAGPELQAATAPSSSALEISHPRRPGALPVIVVVGQGEAVLPDFVVPYGVLAQSGAAKVVAVNMVAGPLKAGALSVTPDMTAAEFDRAYPDGADYVIVPATADKHAEEVAWLRAQRAHGAALVSICDGVELLAQTGALDGRRATGHWASLPQRRKRFKAVTWLTNVRYVADGDVASSAGVSAALPISLALVERIAGAEVARQTASRLGVDEWSAAHDSDLFKVRGDDRKVHMANMRVKAKEVVDLQIRPGDDEVAVALHADAWSRAMRTEVRVVADTTGAVRLRGGLVVRAEGAGSLTPAVRIVAADAGPAAPALTRDLDQIAQRYGAGTARLSALGLEYPWGDLKAAP